MVSYLGPSNPIPSRLVGGGGCALELLSHSFGAPSLCHARHTFEMTVVLFSRSPSVNKGKRNGSGLIWSIASIAT